jgi:hypothetical protein
MRRAAMVGGGALAIALAFALTYGRALSAFFSSDDFVLLHYARDHSALDIVRERLLAGPRSDVASPWWRPGWLLLCNAGYEACGLAPAPYRGVIWTLHAVLTVLVGLVAARATGVLAAALVAAAVFALSPAYAEALLWICAGLNVLPSALCLFLAAVAYASYVTSGQRRALVCVWLAFLLSFTFREASYHLPLVVVAAHITLADAPWPRRLRRGLTHALPFLTVVVVHHLFLNPFAVGGMTLGENLAIAGRHALHWLAALLALPASPWSALALALAVLASWRWLDRRARFCLLWCAAAAFPFVARSHDTRFIYFAQAPLALFVAVMLGQFARRARGLFLVAIPLLLALIAGQATRIHAAVRTCHDAAAINAGFLHLVRQQPAAPTIDVDFLPPELINGAAEMIDLYLGRQVHVVNHALLSRPPFLIYGLPAFAELPADAPLLHFDHAARRFTATTHTARVADRLLVPMLSIRHAVRQVNDWAEVRFDPGVAHLRAPLPDLELSGDGTGKVVSAGAGTVSRFDIGVDTPRDGLLVIAFVADLTTVGGRAYVDGEPAPLLVVDGFFNAVPVRRGVHTVVVKTTL